MTPQQLGKVWTVLGALLAYYAVNSWIVSQGGNEIFGAKLVLSSRVPAAMMAIPICSVLLILTSWIGWLYARRTGNHWHERIPIVGFENLQTKSGEGRVYQGGMLALFSLLPALAFIHFWWVFAAADVVTKADQTKQITSNMWSWSALTSWSDPARICTDYIPSSPIPCSGNATLLPFVEPVAFAILTLLALAALACHWRAVFADGISLQWLFGTTEVPPPGPQP